MTALAFIALAVLFALDYWRTFARKPKPPVVRLSREWCARQRGERN